MTSRALGMFPSRALRMGPENEASHIIGDWMSWNLRGRWTGGDGFDYFANLAAVQSPFLSVAGGADWLYAPASACEDVVERAGSRRKAFVVHPDLTHRGLLRNPAARERCWPETAQWLQDLIGLS
jgi:hypothetical protein